MNGMNEYELSVMRKRLERDVLRLRDELPRMVSFASGASSEYAGWLEEEIKKIIPLMEGLKKSDLTDTELVKLRGYLPTPTVAANEEFDFEELSIWETVDEADFGYGSSWSLKLRIRKSNQGDLDVEDGDSSGLVSTVDSIPKTISTNWAMPIIAKSIGRSRGYMETPTIEKALVEEFLVWLHSNAQDIPLEEAVAHWWHQRTLPKFRESLGKYYSEVIWEETPTPFWPDED